MTFLLIGRDIENSLSPQIHNAILRKIEQSGRYQLCSIEDLELQKNQFFRHDVLGFNVTIPYKQQIIPYLDRLDDTARHAGAVNTVKQVDGKWVGYNTDGLGFIEAIKGHTTLMDPILLMGTGGAAYGIGSALLAYGYKNISVAARRLTAIDPMNTHFKNQFGKTCQGVLYPQIVASDYKMIINATSVGMYGSDQRPLFDYNTLTQNHVVVDIVYKPMMTPLLTQAKNKGAIIIGGINMLLAQALFAQSIWQDKVFVWTDFQRTLYEAVGITYEGI